MAAPLIEGLLIDAGSSAGTVGRSTGSLAAYRQVRVYAEWTSSASAGVVTVRHRARAGTVAEDAGTLSVVAGKANSLRLDGPIGIIEAAITTGVTGTPPPTPSVTVWYVAGGE
jgi:hypothetical protein